MRAQKRIITITNWRCVFTQAHVACLLNITPPNGNICAWQTVAIPPPWLYLNDLMHCMLQLRVDRLLYGYEDGWQQLIVPYRAQEMARLIHLLLSIQRTHTASQCALSFDKQSAERKNISTLRLRNPKKKKPMRKKMRTCSSKLFWKINMLIKCLLEAKSRKL